MLVNRRGILVGLGSLFAAPAIVRASSLMPVKGLSLIDLNQDAIVIPPPGLFTEIVTTTLRNRSKLIWDNVMLNNALFSTLLKQQPNHLHEQNPSQHD